MLDELARLARRLGVLEEREDVEVDLVEELGGTGPEGQPVVVRGERDRDHVGADDPGGRHVGEGDLGR